MDRALRLRGAGQDGLMAHTVTGADYTGRHGQRRLSDVEFDSCTFSNCSIQGGALTDVEFTNCRVWACTLHDVELRNCVIDGLRMTVDGGSGGRTFPLMSSGLLADRVILRGTLGSIICNPPRRDQSATRAATAVDVGAAFYAGVEEYALDIRDAKFTTVPSLRFGPPGHLVRRDPTTQPLIQRQEAERVLALPNLSIGVWRIVLEDLVHAGWPESTVLVPASKGAKKRREKDSADLERLREVATLE